MLSVNSLSNALDPFKLWVLNVLLSADLLAPILFLVSNAILVDRFTAEWAANWELETVGKPACAGDYFCPPASLSLPRLSDACENVKCSPNFMAIFFLVGLFLDHAGLLPP